MRVKLDENLPIQLKSLFTEFGHDASTVLDEGIGGATDAEVASTCLAENRVLVTQDLDFANIRIYPPSQYPGIVVLRLGSQGRDSLLEVGRILVDALAKSSPKGQTWIVEDARLRIRE